MNATVPLVVACCGTLSALPRAFLERAGYGVVDAAVASKIAPVAAILVNYDQIEDFRRHPALAFAPAILIASAINNAAVAAAAEISALDIVLSDDEPHLLAAIGRAVDVQRGQHALTADEENAILRKILDLTPNGVSVRNTAGRFVAVSQSFADFFSTTIEEMIGKAFDGFLSPEDAALESAEDRDVLASRRSKVVERDVVDSSGARRRLQIIKRPLVVTPSDSYVLAVATDVTRRHRTESTLANTNDFLKSVLETISDAVFTLDLSGRFTLVNGRLTELTGYAQHELLGMSFTKIFSPLSLLDAKRSVAEALTRRDQESTREIEGRIAHAHAVERIIAYTLRPLSRNDTPVGVVGMAKDVTERRTAERHIQHLGYHDSLTGLPNRRLLVDRLEVAIAQAHRDRRAVAVLFLDLDRFKAINDSLGHRSGDLLLQEFARRIVSCVRAGDTIARMGGDEFLLLIPALAQDERIGTIAEKILEAVRAPLHVDGREVVVTASIGVSVFPLNATTGDMLIRQADVALFTAKRHGRDTYRLFDERMSAQSSERFELEHELRRAVRDDEFEMYYQPVVDMRSGSTTALEALIRWNHPSRGLLLPSLFIDLAEQVGLIGRIGEWALNAVAVRAAAWQRAGLRAVPIAVNVSARQFDGDIVNMVAATLERTGLDPKYLTLELTEGVLVESAASPTHTLDELKELGVQIAIDDFGTGYSSLSYLERFPIDAIKIDRSFIPHDATNPQAGLIANAIISLGQGLGLRVIAEGVETVAQSEFLLARGCALGQGFLYSPALPAGEIEPLLSDASSAFPTSVREKSPPL